MTWIMTSSGRRIDFVNPDPAEIIIDDILTSLSRNHRFGGFSPMKIGQHIIEVVELMVRRALEENPNLSDVEIAEIVLVGLLHDFPEYVVGDCPTPFKRLLAPLFQNAEEAILNAMLGKWQLGAAYVKHQALLKWADAEAVAQEAIRFKLDGLYIDDRGTEHTVPRVWVPEDKTVNLIAAPMEEIQVSVFLGMYFVKAMSITGRAGLIGGMTGHTLVTVAAETNRTPAEFVASTERLISVGSVFTDEFKAYI